MSLQIQQPSLYWNDWSQRILTGESLPREIGMELLSSHDDDLLAILNAAFKVRQHYFGRGVWLHVIRNARSGECPEDCSYCSQSASNQSEVETYALETVEEIVAGARVAYEQQAVRYCIVTSGRQPVEKDLEAICEAVQQIKQNMPLQICTSLGMLDAQQVLRLKESGVDRYNHNLETSARHYGSICSTHRYEDRLATAKLVKDAGMELCSGGLLGMGEELKDRLDLAYSLREIGADSIPLNFLHPRQGTRLQNINPMKAADALRALALFRLVNPDRELRIAGGRELILGPMQVLGLYPANSFFTKGYLTTDGQGLDADIAMVEAAGFEVAAIADA
ncbi:biotin synthase BioB [Desulfurispira natronophila]|uniref:Biotin synthase n=1 Tax=Desulfurispira natronophila TaxID=682562 RepID=A0A7W7Y333_9BACT|nr:biotin synthase BioB [Desulfurispira natronophila]MBB5021039.1 biotin synthase [Desulfurispira natronophila]